MGLPVVEEQAIHLGEIQGNSVPEEFLRTGAAGVLMLSLVPGLAGEGEDQGRGSSFLTGGFSK